MGETAKKDAACVSKLMRHSTQRGPTMSDPTPAVPDPTVEARADRLADWLGEMPESRNVFDITDEATTVISIDVEALAQRVAVEIHNSVLAAHAAAPDALRVAVEALAAEYDREADVICPRGEYDAKDKAWRVASVRRRVAVDLRDLLDYPALTGRATGGGGS